jgi:hypothetical protein
MSLIFGLHPKVEPKSAEDGGVVIQHGKLEKIETTRRFGKGGAWWKFI